MAAMSEQGKQFPNKHSFHNAAKDTTNPPLLTTCKRSISEGSLSCPQNEPQRLALAHLRGTSAEPFSRKKFRHSAPHSSTADSGSQSPKWASSLLALA